MRARLFPLLAVLALTLSAPVTTLAQADVNHVLRLWAEGANLFLDSCPLSAPEVDTACTGYTVFYAREGLPEGRAKIPFDAFALVEDVVIHPDGTADGSVRAVGFTYETSGTYDKMHLDGASVVASIPMSDGSVFDVNIHWVADGPVAKFGNSGSESQEEGFPVQRFRDACTTANFNDHQKAAHASASGTIGGIDVGSFGNRNAFIFNNSFNWTVVIHGNCAG